MPKEEFAPRFAPYSECLYVGDTAEKDLYKNEEKLKQLGFAITLHDKMPDVVLYREDKNWLYFIEAVTSVGPMDAKRILEIEAMTKEVDSGRIYVTAFTVELSPTDEECIYILSTTPHLKEEIEIFEIDVNAQTSRRIEMYP